MPKTERTPAQVVVEDVSRIKRGEKVLIIANPETNVIAQQLYTASMESGASPCLVFQPKKNGMDNAEPAVIGALKSEPDVIFSVSSVKLGKDPEAISKPYVGKDGESYDHIFDWLLEGKKTARAVWTPGLTEDMFNRTVMIDYKLLEQRCSIICSKYENAVSVHVTSPAGTDVIVPVQGRSPLVDDGDFTKAGKGGNIPAGEVYISPVVGNGNRSVSVEAAVRKGLKGALELIKNGVKKDKNEQNEENNSSEKEELAPCGTQGTIVFDGSMSFDDGDLLLKTPITVQVVDGFITEVSGGEEAKHLLKDIVAAEKESVAMEADGRLPEGQGAVYARNARNIGELGIGLNPAANVTGNMLEDEKAFRTCHFAVGQNFDGDGPALIHYDGIVRNPTVVIKYVDDSEFILLKDGELQI